MKRGNIKKKLLKRVNKENSSQSTIVKLLEIKKKQPISLNPRLFEIQKTKSPHRRVVYEGLKLIKEATNSLDENKIKYKNKEEENQLFLKHFKTYKEINNKNTYKTFQKKEYAFGKLLKTYEYKGMTFQNFFNKDILKESGIILRKKKLIENYYSDEVRRGGEKDRKIVKYENFLSKLSYETKRNLIKRIPFQNVNLIKELEDNIKNNRDFLLGEEQTFQKKKDEIRKLMYENENLENLIEEEKKNFSRTKYNISRNKINGENKRILIDIDDNNISEINNINNYSRIENEVFKKETIKEKKKENDDANITESEIKNTIKKDFEHKILKSLFDDENEVSKFKSMNVTRRTKKLGTTFPSMRIPQKILNKKVTCRKSSSNLDTNSKKAESRLFEIKLRKQNTLKHDNNINRIVIPKLFENSKNKRKINMKNISVKSTDRTLAKSIMKNSNSQPNIFSIKDTYEKLKECNKKKYQIENINKILDDYFGKKLSDVNAKNVGIKFYYFLNQLKRKLYKNQYNDYIYNKYKDILSKEFKEKINMSKTLTEKIKTQSNFFIEKYTEQINKLNQKK